jgi:hypothetical protein
LNQVKWELFASNEEVVVAEQLSVSDIALERTPESDVTKADIVGTNDCSASLESLTMPENRNALPENSSHTGEGRVEAEIKGEEGLGDQEEPSKEVMVSNDPIVEGALLPQATSSALTNPTMDETTSAGSNKRKEEQIRGESKSDAETAPQNNIKAYNNVKAYIKKYGHDEDFIPSMVDLPGTPEDELYLPTEAPAGTRQKVAVLRKRVKLGQHLWHPNDRVDYEGIRENLARAKVR